MAKKLVPGVDVSQRVYDLAVQCFRKQKEAVKGLAEKGLKLCPACQAIAIPEKSDCCVICENKRKGKVYGQGTPTGLLKG